ncbi:hypothetical protein MHI04_11800 [Lysinibacillus sp. FSL K6-1151]|uniref:hypothetical protein n=1 Tax=Lysinibacillus sp. FSL K6-1151 TaxID=2921465 RepID=UPI00315A7534
MKLSINCSETVSDTQSAVCGAITNTLLAPQIICSNETFFINLNTLLNFACEPNTAGGLSIDEIFAVITTGNATFTGNIIPGEFQAVVNTVPPNSIFLSYSDAIIDFQPTQSGQSIIKLFDPFVGLEVAASSTLVEQPIIVELFVVGQTFIGPGCTCGPNFDGYASNLRLELVLVPATHPCCTTCPLLLDIVLSKNVQVQSKEVLKIQGTLCEPRNELRKRQKLNEHYLKDNNHFECIQAQCVHDWVVFCTEHQRKVPIPENCNRQILKCRRAGEELTILCKTIPNTCSFTVLDNDIKPLSGIHAGKLVPIRFTINIRIQYYCNGESLCHFDVPITTVDEIVLCFPEGTFIKAEISDVISTIVGENG